MEGRKRVLITQAESEGSVSGSSPTQDTAFSDVQEGTRERSTRAGSGTHHSQFSHDSVYSEGRYLEPSERGYDTGDDTGDDTISIVDSRRRNESLYDDVLEEEEEEEEEEDENNDDNNSMEGWDVSQSDSSDDEDESVHELRDSDYDTDLDMNDDKYLHPEKYDHDTTGMAKYLKACKELGLQPIRYFMKHMQDEHLKLRYHGLGPSAMKALAAPLECNTAIEHMDLEGNWIMAEGTVHLCRVLRENVFLTELNLSENKIEDEGATTVCKLLIENRTIERLELAGNNISDHTGEILHELLTQSNSVLKRLNLRHNRLEDESAQWLRDALGENETLEHLDVSWNHFQSKGCVLLAEGLGDNVGLKEFCVAMNGFGQDGGKELGDALRENRTLVRLDASYCRLPISCAGSLALGLENNDVLQYLDVSYNTLKAEGALAMLTSIDRNEASGVKLLNLGNTKVFAKFKTLQDKLEEERDLKVLHGGVLDEVKKEVVEIDPMEAFLRDPFTKLKEWVARAGYRLIDLLRHFDKDQSMTISIEEFREGIEATSIPITEEQIQILVARLDQDGDGEIDFRELMEGDKEHRKTKRDIDRYIMEKEEKEKQIEILEEVFGVDLDL